MSHASPAPSGSNASRAPNEITYKTAEQERREAQSLERRQWAIRQVVPTEAWFAACDAAFEHGDAKPKAPDPAAELEKRGIFPPGPGRATGPSPVATPMQPCQSRACTGRHGRGRAKRVVNRRFPHYAVAGETRTPSYVEVAGVNVAGLPVVVQLEARGRREAFALARARGVMPTAVRVIRRGQRLRLCDDCRLALQEAQAARDRARERREEAARAAELAAIAAAAGVAAEAAEVDFAGRPVVDEEPPATAYAEAMEEIRARGAMVEQRRLPTEDEGQLREQIDRYLAGKRTSLMPLQFAAGEAR